MANNREMYCEHCGRDTLFFQESDMLWYCDECDHVYGSIPDDDDFWDDDFADDDDEELDGEKFDDDDFWDDDFADADDDELDDDDFWDDDFANWEDGEVIKCRNCNNLIAIDDLVDGYLCPVCFDDLSSKLENFDEE